MPEIRKSDKDSKTKVSEGKKDKEPESEETNNKSFTIDIAKIPTGAHSC